jgi:hypothetical protein
MRQEGTRWSEHYRNPEGNPLQNTHFTVGVALVLVTDLLDAGSASVGDGRGVTEVAKGPDKQNELWSQRDAGT